MIFSRNIFCPCVLYSLQLEHTFLRTRTHAQPRTFCTGDNHEVDRGRQPVLPAVKFATPSLGVNFTPGHQLLGTSSWKRLLMFPRLI